MILEGKMKLDWEHIYLLGWYDQSGKSYLTTWSGDLPIINVIVTGPSSLHTFGPPLWKAPAQAKLPGAPLVEEFQLHEITIDDDPIEEARDLNGVVAVGWYIEEGFKRKWETT